MIPIMNYQNFEAHIDYSILQRGQQYFALETIKELKKEKTGWEAIVEGSVTYSVSIKGQDEIEHWACTCPFDQGPICKHVAAVLYAIQNRKFEDMMKRKNT